MINTFMIRTSVSSSRETHICIIEDEKLKYGVSSRARARYQDRFEIAIAAERDEIY